MSLQTTLLTSHKGVDLHAATALRVMQDRLEGGRMLTGLFRCEFHTFWDEAPPGGVDRLLQIGRFYNPNKHHFGVFVRRDAGRPWPVDDHHELDAGWPGPVRREGHAGDPLGQPDLHDFLLGGAVPPGHTSYEVAAFPRGEQGPLLSGVLWRLVIAGGPGEAAQVGPGLAVARGRKQGLLINPHMERWLAAVR